MVAKKKQNLENDIVIVIFFFFVSTQEKYLRDLTEFLKKHNIFLHKNTKYINKILLENKKQELCSSMQANYIGIGSQKLGKEQFKDILLFLSVKNTKYMSFFLSYNQKILRPKILSLKREKKISLIIPSVLNA